MKLSSKSTVLILGVIAVWVGGIFFLAMPRWKELTTVWESVKTLKAEDESLKAQVTAKTAELAAYGTRDLIPKGIQLRPYTPETFDKSLKILLDTLVEMAIEHGALFISLEPDKDGDSAEAPVSAAPAASASATPAAEGAAPTSTEASSASTTPAVAPPPPEAQLKSFGYKLSVRGSYDEIISFLNAVSQLKEVLAVRQIVLTNEAAPQEGASPSTTEIAFNPLKPLRLDSFIQIYMVENAENIPAEYMVKATADVARP